MENYPSFRVKIKASGKYIQIKWYAHSIIGLSFVDEKEKASVFQRHDEMGRARCAEINFLLYNKGIQREALVIEEIMAPQEPLFDKEDIKEFEEMESAFKKYKSQKLK